MAKYKLDYYKLLNALWANTHSNTLYNIVETEKVCSICGGKLYNIWAFMKPKGNYLVFHCAENDEHEFTNL